MSHSTKRRSAARDNVADTLELLAARFPRLARYAPRSRAIAVTTNATARENLLAAREAFARARSNVAHLGKEGR